MSSTLLSTSQYTLEIMATLAFAASGLIEAARKRMDAVGIGVVASVAAFGGGTLRDLLLDRRPLFWVDNVELLWLVLGLTLLAIVFLRSRHLEITERAMLWPDAIGLGLFCAVGTQIALELEMPLLVAAVMGVITAIFGGVLRDMVCNEIPRVLSDHRPYAICAFIGAWVLIAADMAGFEDWASLLLAAVVASSLRLIAVKLDWELPRWRD